ncbi:uncharacterized protein LTR77_000023 [Saxophila tyrrhenica]|uniref:Extracellular membrane protein CFEM domain-containing protein n=1 Tax=Saxophila tyrrhenica TaxID=1690608 RepID=A0AAV9PM29_9PEZI|nr:hypothetical protein LTR77_000023 [Saxophila tyrrhenica]
MKLYRTPLFILAASSTAAAQSVSSVNELLLTFPLCSRDCLEESFFGPRMEACGVQSTSGDAMDSLCICAPSVFTDKPESEVSEENGEAGTCAGTVCSSSDVYNEFSPAVEDYDDYCRLLQQAVADRSSASSSAPLSSATPSSSASPTHTMQDMPPNSANRMGAAPAAVPVVIAAFGMLL